MLFIVTSEMRLHIFLYWLHRYQRRL